jgi:hypothetical protein
VQQRPAVRRPVRRAALSSLAASVLTLSAAPAAWAAVDVTPVQVALPDSVRVAATCPAGAAYTSATVDVPELDRRLVVHVDDGTVRTRVALVAPADRAVESFDVQVTCRTAEGDRADAGSRRVRVDADPQEATTPVAAPASEDEPVSALVPLVAFGLVSVAAFVAFGVVGRARGGAAPEVQNASAQRGVRRRARR